MGNGVTAMSVYQVDKLMGEARRLAAEYRRATGKTLAISGEIAVSDVIHLLGLEPAPADAEGYDVVRMRGDVRERLQVKARTVFDDTRRPARLGQLRMDKPWDAALLVLMDDDYEPIEIHEPPSVGRDDADIEDSQPGVFGDVGQAHVGDDMPRQCAEALRAVNRYRHEELGPCVQTRHEMQADVSRDVQQRRV